MKNHLFIIIITLVATSGRMTAAPPGIAKFDSFTLKGFLRISADDPYPDVTALDQKIFRAIDDYLDLEIERINREAAETADELWPHLDHGLKVPYHPPSVGNLRVPDRVIARRIQVDSKTLLAHIERLEEELDLRLAEVYRDLPKVENIADGASIKDQLWFLSAKAFPITLARVLSRIEPTYASGIRKEAQHLCPTDPLRSGLMERQMQAILLRTDDSLKQRHQVRTMFHHMLSCLSEESYVEFDNALYAASRVIEQRLINADLQYLIPQFQMSILPVMLSSYDSIKYLGKTTGSYRWFERWWSVLIEMIKQGQHPFERDLLMVLDIRTGRTVGVQIYCDDGGQSQDCVNFPAFLRSLADPARLGVGACSNLEMIRSGVSSLGGTLGYNCSIGVCPSAGEQRWEMIPEETITSTPSNAIERDTKTVLSGGKSPFGVPLRKLRADLCPQSSNDDPFVAAHPDARLGPSSGFNACAGFPKKILPNGICGFSPASSYGSPGGFSCGISVPSACEAGLDGMFEVTSAIEAVKDPQCTLADTDSGNSTTEYREGPSPGDDWDQDCLEDSQRCEPNHIDGGIKGDIDDDNDGNRDGSNNSESESDTNAEYPFDPFGLIVMGWTYDPYYEQEFDDGDSVESEGEGGGGSEGDGDGQEGGATPDDSPGDSLDTDDPELDESLNELFTNFGDKESDEGGATPSEEPEPEDDLEDPEVEDMLDDAFPNSDAGGTTPDDPTPDDGESNSEEDRGDLSGPENSTTAEDRQNSDYGDQSSSDFDNTSADLGNGNPPAGGGNSGAGGGDSPATGSATQPLPHEKLPQKSGANPGGFKQAKQADRMEFTGSGYKPQTPDGKCPKVGLCKLVDRSSGGELTCLLSNGKHACQFSKVPKQLQEACKEDDTVTTCQHKVRAIHFFRKNGGAQFKKFIKLLNQLRQKKYKAEFGNPRLFRPITKREQRIMLEELPKAVKNSKIISKQEFHARYGKKADEGFAESRGIRNHQIYIDGGSYIWRRSLGHHILVHEGMHIMAAVMEFMRKYFFTAKDSHDHVTTKIMPMEIRVRADKPKRIYYRDESGRIKFAPPPASGSQNKNSGGQNKNSGSDSSNGSGGGRRLTDGSDSSCTALSKQMRRFRSCVNNSTTLPNIPKGGEDFEIVPGITNGLAETRSCVPSNPVQFNRDCLWSFCSDSSTGNCCGSSSAGGIDFDRAMERQCYDVYCPSGQVVMDGGGCRCSAGDNSFIGEQELLDKVMVPKEKAPVVPDVDVNELTK